MDYTTTITQQQFAAKLDVIAREMSLALAEIGKRHGVDIKHGRITYSNAGTFSTRVEGKTDAAKRTLLTMAVGSDVLHKTFAHKGANYTVVNIDNKKRKYPIVAEKVGDPTKRLLFPLAYVKRQLDTAAGKFGG